MIGGGNVRPVLDLASGTGYGSAILAGAGATEVKGVDISADAVAFARANYNRGNLEFENASAMDYDPSPAPDVWVTLETVEHLENPGGYLTRIHERLARKIIGSLTDE